VLQSFTNFEHIFTPWSIQMSKRIKSIEPPDDLAGDALAEWHRLMAAAKSARRQFQEADRNVLTLACKTLIVHRACYGKVSEEGAVMTFANGVVGQNPWFKTYKETTALLRGLLADLGCTPKSRDFDAADAKKPKELPPLVF